MQMVCIPFGASSETLKNKIKSNQCKYIYIYSNFVNLVW